MPTAFARVKRIPRLSRFGWLMGLYAENFGKLTRLFEPADLAPGAYMSSTGDGLDLRLDVIEQHRFTTELRMTYSVRDPQTGEPDPSAFIRLYRDARQAEATHCYVGRRWQDVIGLYPPTEAVIGHRMRMNTFLGKWLDYLAEGGHGVARLQPAMCSEVEFPETESESRHSREGGNPATLPSTYEVAGLTSRAVKKTLPPSRE